MRKLLRREGWSPSGVLVGLDEGDPNMSSSTPHSQPRCRALQFALAALLIPLSLRPFVSLVVKRGFREWL